MTTATDPRWTPITLEPHRFSADDFARLLDQGILDEGCELSEGVVTRDGETYRFSVEQYERMEQMPVHDGAVPFSG